MKKIVFTLSAITAVCACGLVIDPDKLVEGNGTPLDTTETGPDTSTGGVDGSGGDAANDGGTDGSIVVEVPECVPPPPSIAGAKGPYAIVTVAKGAPVACPPGYLATAVDQGDGEFNAPSAECNSSAGCTCGAATGSAKCGLRVRYYDDSACTKEADTPTSLGGFNPCPNLDSEDFLQLEATVSGITCTPGGSTTPTAKPAPTFAKTTIICAPDPNVKTAQCKGSDIPLPAAKDAEACILVPVAASCSGGDYRSDRLLTKTGAVNDGRGCTCGCTGNAATSCTGGTAKAWDGFFCSGAGANTTLPLDACVDRGGKDVIGTDTAPSASGSPSCSTRATPTGEASPTWDLKLCCLGAGGD